MDTPHPYKVDTPHPYKVDTPHPYKVGTPHPYKGCYHTPNKGCTHGSDYGNGARTRPQNKTPAVVSPKGNAVQMPTSPQSSTKANR